MSLIDDLDHIKKIDKSNMLAAIINFPNYMIDCFQLCNDYDIMIPKDFKNIIIAGLGGSAIGGDIVKNWIGDRVSIPIEVRRDYQLPGYANEETMLIVVSYSGETEEALRLFLEGIKKRCKIFTVTSGGILDRLNEKQGIPRILVPSGMPPRAALPYLFTSIAFIMWKCNLIADLEKELKIASSQLSENIDFLGIQNSLENNPAKKLALSIKDTIPVIYSSKNYESAGRRFKTQINENCKIFAKYDVMPEACHNDIEGWKEKESLIFSIIFITDGSEDEHSLTEIRNILKEKGFKKLFEIKASGKNKLARIMSTIIFGDFVSFYLAILNNIDPTPIPTISNFKERISKKSRLKEIIEEKLKT
jgi:glucose/mannose-6-phosphate isomerase